MLKVFLMRGEWAKMTLALALTPQWRYAAFHLLFLPGERMSELG